MQPTLSHGRLGDLVCDVEDVIVGWLAHDVVTLCRLAAVASRWQAAVDREGGWQDLLKEEFPISFHRFTNQASDGSARLAYSQARLEHRTLRPLDPSPHSDKSGSTNSWWLSRAVVGSARTVASIFKKREKPRIVVTGLDGAGKTTMLCSAGFEHNERSWTRNTFVTEAFSNDFSAAFDVDAGVADKMKPLLRLFYASMQGVVLVISSSPVELEDTLSRLPAELQWMMSLDAMRENKNIPILVFANKQDVPGAKGAEYLAAALDLVTVFEGHPWIVQPCSAVTKSPQVDDGFQWLLRSIG